MMKRSFLLYYIKVVSIAVMACWFSFYPVCSYAQHIDAIESPYSEEVRELANDIVISHFLYDEARDFYRKRDYVNAKLKLEEAIKRDPENRKAQKFLKRVDKIAEQQQKKKKKEKTKLERRALGLFGVRRKNIAPMLTDIPVKDIPKKRMLLDECIKIAVENSLPLDVAKKQINLAEIRLWESMRKLVPTIKGRWEESGGKVIGRGYEGRKFMMELSQPIFYGGELCFTVNQAKVNLEIVKHDLYRVRNELILKVEKAYYSLDKAEKFLDIERSMDKKSHEINDFITKGYDSGVVNKLEFLNVSSKCSQIKFQYISAEEDMSLARLMLQQAMNTEEDVYILPVGEPIINNKISLVDCYTLAYTNRPEIKINFLMTEYYLYEKKIKNAHLLPKVDGMGSYGYKYEDFSDHLDRGGGSPSGAGGRNERLMKPEWYIGFKASMPFFGSTLGYSLAKESWQPVVSAYHGTKSLTSTMTFSILDDLKFYSDRKEAEIGLTRAKEEYNKVRQEVTLEVKETYFKYKKAIMQMDVARSKAAYQRNQVAFLDLKREMNEGAVSSVLEEMIKLGEEEFSFLQAIADYYISIKSLNKAIGIIGYFDHKKKGSLLIDR